MTYDVGFFAVMLGHFLAFGAKVLLKGWVKDKLLADGVAGKLPDEPVAVALLVVMVARIVDYFIVVLLQFAMVLMMAAEMVDMAAEWWQTFFDTSRRAMCEVVS